MTELETVALAFYEADKAFDTTMDCEHCHSHHIRGGCCAEHAPIGRAYRKAREALCDTAIALGRKRDELGIRTATPEPVE